MKTIGIIVNPFAGLGGRVGLKGSDGEELREKAFSLGAVSEARNRTAQALSYLVTLQNELRILAGEKEMGEEALKDVQLTPFAVISTGSGENTTRKDTIACARKMKEEGAQLLLFAGGDGTARDIMEAVGCDIPVLGIPAGVKMHSAVYAKTPKLAGLAAHHFLSGGSVEIREAEVMDIDEEAFREGRVKAKLFGYLRVPYESKNMQGLKSPSPESEGESLLGIAEQTAGRMERDMYYVIGPGTTTREVMKVLGLTNTLLGVDVVKNKKLVASDIAEEELYSLLKGNAFRIIITPIGGQGIILGRGNQQIGPKVLSLCRKEDLTILATKEKINEIYERVLCVDLGDERMNERFRGYYRVVSAYQEETILKCI